MERPWRYGGFALRCSGGDVFSFIFSKELFEFHDMVVIVEEDEGKTIVFLVDNLIFLLELYQCFTLKIRVIVETTLVF